VTASDQGKSSVRDLIASFIGRLVAGTKPLIDYEIVQTGNAEDQPFVVRKLGRQ
jgi:hypothetical protein